MEGLFGKYGFLGGHRSEFEGGCEAGAKQDDVAGLECDVAFLGDLFECGEGDGVVVERVIVDVVAGGVGGEVDEDGATDNALLLPCCGLVRDVMDYV